MGLFSYLLMHNQLPPNSGLKQLFLTILSVNRGNRWMVVLLVSFQVSHAASVRGRWGWNAHSVSPGPLSERLGSARTTEPLPHHMASPAG